MGIYLSPLERITRFVIAIKNYVESGFIGLLNTGTCAEDTYKPGTLNYNTAVAAYVTGTSTPMQGKLTVDDTNMALDEYPFTGEALADGSESKAVGCSTKIATINPCGITFSAGGYCNTEQIIDQKKTQASVPSSLYSGKMRLFVQAIYGSLRRDYTSNWAMPVFDRCLIVAGFKLSHSLTPLVGNHWLITTAEYNYFIVRVVGTSVKFYPLELIPAAQIIRGFMLSSGRMGDKDFVTRCEAYILAYATIGAESHSITASGAFLGTPAAYGWHSKWSGLVADVVAHEADVVNRQYNARHYRLTITPTYDAELDSYTFSAAIATITTEIWWPLSKRLMFFRPEWAVNDTEWLPLVGTPVRGAEVADWAAKVYCFYDANDVIQVISAEYSRETWTSGNHNVDPSAAAVYMGDVHVTQHYITGTSGINGAHGFQSLKINGVIIEQTEEKVGSAYRYTRKDPVSGPIFGGYRDVSGWHGGAIDYSSAWRDIDTNNFQDWMVINGYWIDTTHSVNFGPIDRGDGVMTGTFCEGKFYYMQYDSHSENTGQINYAGSLFIEIPAGDCEAYFYGKAETHYTGTYNSSNITTMGYGSYGFDIVKYYQHITLGRQYLGVLGESGPGRYALQYSGAGTASVNRPSPNTDYTHEVGYSRDSDSGQPLMIDEATQTLNWHFYKDPSEGMLGTMENARSGIDRDAYKYDFTLGATITGENEFPGDSSTGWV